MHKVTLWVRRVGRFHYSIYSKEPLFSPRALSNARENGFLARLDHGIDDLLDIDIDIHAYCKITVKVHEDAWELV